MIENKKKHVLVITEVFAPEEFLINDLVFFWKKQGLLVSVLTRNPSYPDGKIFYEYKNKLFQKEYINEVPIYRVQFIRGYKNNSFVKIINYAWNMILATVWAIKNGNKFDKIFIYQTGPLTFSTSGIIIKKFYHKETTIWSQDIWPDTVHAYGWAKGGVTNFILNQFVKWVYSNCDNITVSCPGFVSRIQRFCPDKNISFIPQWSLTKKYNEDIITEKNKLSGSFNFVFAGNIGKVQNLENAISGFNQFQNQAYAENVRLNIIGDGSHLIYLKEFVRAKNIKNVSFWGRVKSSDMPSIFESADILIISLENQPIFNLTIPAKFQSYLNAEKPIFGIIGGEVADLINKYNLGWTVSPDDINEISNTFQKIVSSNTEILKEKKKNAGMLLEEQFNREKIIEKFTDLVFG
jgi:glycosyltransferase involved in cell wall biosynthesis